MSQAYEIEQFWHPMLSSHLSGAGALPPQLGLSHTDFNHMLELAFANAPEGIQDNSNAEKRALYQTLAELRRDETAELSQLLDRYAESQRFYTKQAVAVIAAACLGSAHLWSDLGLPERPRLSEMIRYYFPELFTLNNRNMRWKRFFYKQLCEQGGDYVCRAPSCEECSSYSECFTVTD